MMKYFSILFLFVTFFQNAQAQKANTLFYYMKNSVEITANQDSAEFYLRITLPGDSSTGVKIYPIEEYYTNRKIKLRGTASINASPMRIYLKFEGQCVEYFNEGGRKCASNYINGQLIGDKMLYYPNGKLYAVEKYYQNDEPKLTDCRDSTGKVLAENGNGQWQSFDDVFKKVTEEGPIKDGLQNGEWQEVQSDTEKYTTIYSNGKITSSTNPYKNGKKRVGQNSVREEHEPKFKNGGMAGFNAYLEHYTKYPAIDFDNNVERKVIVTFVVEKDGSLTDIKALKTPSKTLADAVIQAVKESPLWSPGIQNGQAVRVQYTYTFYLPGN